MSLGISLGSIILLAAFFIVAAYAFVISVIRHEKMYNRDLTAKYIANFQFGWIIGMLGIIIMFLLLAMFYPRSETWWVIAVSSVVLITGIIAGVDASKRMQKNNARAWRDYYKLLLKEEGLEAEE